mmetsp:Transcript_122/g.366  ORF Transcript_122/g.366 Transcript_122/m.366 type:complete len:298 (+) Transcript_122:71-964(+)
MLWADHPVVLPCHSTELESLEEQCGSWDNDSSQEHPGGVGSACEDATKMEDDQEERQSREVQLSQAGVGNPLPLVRVDLLHGVIPARVLHHLPDVAHSEAVDKSQARKPKCEVRSEAPLLDVPGHASPMVAVKVRAARQENPSARGVQGIRAASIEKRIRAVGQGMDEAGQSVERPPARCVEAHLVVLVHLVDLLESRSIEAKVDQDGNQCLSGGGLHEAKETDHVEGVKSRGHRGPTSLWMQPGQICETMFLYLKPALVVTGIKLAQAPGSHSHLSVPERLRRSVPGSGDEVAAPA